MVLGRRTTAAVSGVVMMVALGARAQSWSELGPQLGGRLMSIVPSLTDPNVLFVATPGGGVWGTTNNGVTWTPYNRYLADFAVVHMTRDLADPNQLIALTYSDLYTSPISPTNTLFWTNRSRNGGYPAALMPPTMAGMTPRPFAQRLFPGPVRMLVFALPCEGLFWTTDLTTYHHEWIASGGSNNPDNCVYSMAFDESSAPGDTDNPNRLYLTTAGTEDILHGSSPQNHVFRSAAWTAAGPPTPLVWQPVSSGLPSSYCPLPIMHLGGPGQFGVVVDTGSAQYWRTTTGGSAWSSPGTASTWSPSNMFRTSASQLMIGGGAPWYSNDGGGSWTGFPNTAIGIHGDTRAFATGTYGGTTYIWGITDGTAVPPKVSNIARWTLSPSPTSGQTINFDTPTFQVYFTAVAGPTPAASQRRVFIGMQDNLGACSDDLGMSWGRSGSAALTDGLSMVFAPSNHDVAYARDNAGDHFYVTRNATSAASCSLVQWTQINTGVPLPYGIWSRAVTAVHPTDPSVVYLAGDRYLNVARLNLATTPPALVSNTPFMLPAGAYGSSVFVDSAAYVYVGTINSGILKSTTNGTGGLTFAPLAGSPSSGVVMRMAQSCAGGGTFFAATTDGLWRQVAGGAWSRVLGGGGYVVSSVEPDPACPRRVYASMGWSGLGQHRGGVLVSDDNGTSWRSLTAGLDIHQTAVPDIQIDPVSPRYLFAATYGRGVWRYDTGTTPASCGCP